MAASISAADSTIGDLIAEAIDKVGKDGVITVEESNTFGIETDFNPSVLASASLVIGFSINFVANTFIFPLVGAQITPAQNFWMGWIYTSVSIVRQYAVRRFFNAMLHAAALRLSGDHK